MFIFIIYVLLKKKTQLIWNVTLFVMLPYATKTSKGKSKMNNT